MAQSHWKDIFPPHIWLRGLDYYHNGHILDIQFHGNRATAEIEGNNVYTVSVTLNAGRNRIEDYSCDCPYGEDGTPCKHLAALLCALEDADSDDFPGQEENTKVEQVVALLSAQQMRELLIQFAKSDTYIWEKIQLTATNQLPPSQKIQWEIDLQNLTDSATGRYGYIDYEEAYDYCIDLNEYLEDRIPDLLASGLTMDAFELTCLVFQTGIEQDMDDSDGGTTLLAGFCMETWTKILEASDLNAQREMFGWFISHYADHDLCQMFLEEYIFGAPWNTALTPELLRFLDQQLQKCLERSVGSYQLSDLIVHRIRWMEKAGAEKSEIEKFMTTYHYLPAVREMQISQAMHDRDYRTALALLEESAELDKDKSGLLAKYSAQKIEIYEITGNALALRRALEHHIFTFRQDNLVYAEKLKALQTADEWAAMRCRLLDIDSMRSQVYPLLEREEMYEQMMERVESHTDIYCLERYESILKKEFPLRCRNVYVAHLQQAMSRASNRKAYWSVIQTLKKLRKYPDGTAVARELADSWKQRHPRRSSMLDELKKAGF